MSTDAAPADTSSAGALPRPRPRTADDVEGPSASALTALAARLADGMRRDVRNCTRFERRLHVLDLLHRDPQLLTETVLELAEDAPPPPPRGGAPWPVSTPASSCGSTPTATSPS